MTDLSVLVRNWQLARKALIDKVEATSAGDPSFSHLWSDLGAAEAALASYSEPADAIPLTGTGVMHVSNSLMTAKLHD